MTTIYDNPEYQHSGYSGVLQYEFEHKDFRFSISKGSTNSSGGPSANAYHISVVAVGMAYLPLFDLFAYQGDPVGIGMLYAFLEDMQPRSVATTPRPGTEEQIANFIFATACQNINTVDLFRYALDTTHRASIREGKEEVRDAIKQILGIAG